MKIKVEAIQKAFNKRGIELKESVGQAKSHVFSEGLTNRFLTVEDINGQRYLIRINGKLWPPFSRESEHHNLALLNQHQLKTTLVANNPKQGFQICHLQDEAKKFTHMLTQDDRSAALHTIAKTIKNYHHLPDFKNYYSYTQTLGSACRLLKNTSTEMIAIRDVVLRIFALLAQDTDNFVASHNDLLPSSIYLDQGEIVIVDWEYSGKNHRSYDLALFSLKSSLSHFEEAQLVRSYDPVGETDIEYSLPLMKAGINFLLLLWELASTRHESDQNAIFLFKALNHHLQNCFFNQSAKVLHTEKRYGFFKSPPTILDSGNMEEKEAKDNSQKGVLSTNAPSSL